MATDDKRRKVAWRLRDDAESGALPYSDFLGAVAYDVGAEKEHTWAAIREDINPNGNCSCNRGKSIWSPLLSIGGI